ncbi:MAG TPA: YeeE/YedE thiosulfate transporter family protein [Burkholderiaceae bacterium]|nr:YeeE/YedE thiosulfate transporter family protein [Burkholderiaceae bacterium]
MEPILLSVAVVLAMLCAGVMGYAIQRGATCTVAAVDELLTKRKAGRLLAMGEASLWVAGGLALADVLHALPSMPAAYPASGWVVAGAVLLGIGAWVNGGCVFGAIARFGSGDTNYLATPLGYYVGCLSVGALFAAPAAMPLDDISPVLRMSGAAALAFVVFAAWRTLSPLARSAFGPRPVDESPAGRTIAARLWAPHAATGVIGVTFVIILLLVGVWAYTDVLAQIARGVSMRLALGVVCLLALYLGALAGGWTAGRLRPTLPTLRGASRCFAGGVLMAWGSLLIPGSNDGLILIGMPLLRPYAWLAFAVMCLTIAAAMLVARRWAAHRAGESSQFDHEHDGASRAS